jgi:hypothetical protein
MKPKETNMITTLQSPTPDEYASFYSDYIERAQQKDDVLETLPQQIDEVKSALRHLTDEQARFKFGPSEWSIKEVIGHLIDGERVFSYRLLSISRNDQTPLPGFEQEDYVRDAMFDNYALADLIHEFEFLRRANILLILNMREESTRRLGNASGATVSARALIYIMVGHVEHHMVCLREKYLPNLK